eukprot:9370477-Karenia_brevis.AAC.1
MQSLAHPGLQTGSIKWIRTRSLVIVRARQMLCRVGGPTRAEAQKFLTKQPQRHSTGCDRERGSPMHPMVPIFILAVSFCTQFVTAQAALFGMCAIV